MIGYRVPASTTNLGHGFDCLGIAIDLRNEVLVEERPRDAEASISGSDGAIVRALAGMTEAVRQEAQRCWGCILPTLRTQVRGTVPIARGLGSSATILVGVACACRVLAGLPEDAQAVTEVAAAVEGHPDNVAAAALGGFTIAGILAAGMRLTRFRVPDSLQAVLSIPAYEVATSEARRILPSELSRRDAVQAISRTALVVAALASGRSAELAGLFEDAWHERFRAGLNPGLAPTRIAAAAAGALGTILSGSGSTVLSFVTPATGPGVVQALRQAAIERGERMDIRQVAFANDGAQRFEA